MGTGRRLAVLLLALTLIGLPAVMLRVACVGASCRSSAVAASASAPFCSLPRELRDLITTGTYEERSPDVMGVAASTPVVSDVGDVEVPWPSVARGARAAMKAPLWFLGRAIDRGRLPRDVTLDRIAPTLAPLIGLQRAHPDVRSGTAIPGVVDDGGTTPLVVLIVWKGIGIAEQDAYYRQPMQDGNVQAPRAIEDVVAKSVDGLRHPRHLRGVRWAVGTSTAGSLPLDPTAVEATIGTGGLPFQHGITGTEIRDANGEVVTAFGRSAPQPVIATLGDDLDEATDGEAKIGLVGSSPGDMGLTGDDWYRSRPGSIVDRRQVVRPGSGVDVASFLAEGWGADTVPDLLAIGLLGSYRSVHRVTGAVEEHVLRAIPGATIVVAGTGSLSVQDAVEAPMPPGTDAVAAGGVFVQQGTHAFRAQDVVDALRGHMGPDGSPLLADTFASYAVQFGRYC